MAERDIMEYAFYTECTFISNLYAIFNITIKRNYVDKNGRNVVYEGNVIIDKQLNIDSDGNLCYEEFDDTKLIKERIREARNKCIRRAKWIFRY